MSFTNQLPLVNLVKNSFVIEDHMRPIKGVRPCSTPKNKTEYAFLR